MIKVITYGTYDMLHYGHIKLLERAKALGDYLIVGVTADDFDKTRGKINVKQSLMERVEAVKNTGLADEIIIEEYEGQKIDDIKRNNVDIFTVGSDWEGQFDYLKEYCQVIYLPRTEGISSTEIRAKERKIKLGFIGTSSIIKKVAREVQFVNGLKISGYCSKYIDKLRNIIEGDSFITDDFDKLLDVSDAIYVLSHPANHYEQVKYALNKGKNVICESPIALKESEVKELFALAKKNGCVLFDAIKTAYSTAYNRLLVLAKAGAIGKIVSIDATCTSIQDKIESNKTYDNSTWGSVCEWAPTALMPIFQLLGDNYKSSQIVSSIVSKEPLLDSFTKVDFIYDNAVASIKVGKGIKSEGDLIISGTNGYIYVPAPWWKTDYFEVRYENATNNKRYFYQLDGEGIRYELVVFAKEIETGKNYSYLTKDISSAISKIVEIFYKGEEIKLLNI